MSGEVEIPAEAPSFQGGRLHVTVANVTYADAAARPIGQATVEDVHHVGGSSTRVPFSITVGADLDPRDSFAVDAWLDTAQAGRLEKGSLISDEMALVLTRGHGRNAHLRLRLV